MEDLWQASSMVGRTLIFCHSVKERTSSGSGCMYYLYCRAMVTAMLVTTVHSFMTLRHVKIVCSRNCKYIVRKLAPYTSLLLNNCSNKVVVSFSGRHRSQLIEDLYEPPHTSTTSAKSVFKGMGFLELLQYISGTRYRNI